MRILARHVLREFLQPVIYCILGFAMIFVVLDLFGNMDRIVAAHPPWRTLLTYYAGLVLPELKLLVPASLLLGGLYAMWQLARHSEITAMRASGVGFGAITAPMLWASVVLAVLLALSNEFLAPPLSRQARQIAKARFQPTGRLLHLDVPFNHYAARRVWRIGRLDLADESRLAEVRVVQSGTNGLPEYVLTGRRAEHLDGAWWFLAPYVTLYDAEGNPRPAPPPRTVLCMPDYDEQPRDFSMEVTQDERGQENLALRDMIRYVQARPRLPRIIKVGRRFDIHYRLASPWACVVITLFAIPAGVASGRQSVFKGVVLAIALFFAFYALTMVCMAASKRDLLPVGLGAWLPNAIFLLAGLVLFHRQR